MPFLNLPPSQFECVFALIRDRIMANVVLNEANVLRVFLDGDANQNRDLESYPAPVVIFEPRFGPRHFRDESTQAGMLIVTMRARIDPGDTADHMRLEKAIEESVNSYCSCPWVEELVQAGATNGLILFAQPLNPVQGKTSADLGQMTLSGSFSIEVFENC